MLHSINKNLNFAILLFATLVTCYLAPTKIKCRKDMYSRLSILGAINTFIPTTEECFACLYAIQNDEIYFQSCLGREYEFGYRNFSEFVKNGCQKEFQCYTCYSDNCNIPSNTNTNSMIPVQKFSSLNSFKCYHGEREASQFQLRECSNKRCVIMYNFEHRYWATSCESPSTYFPSSQNMTLDYYYCNTSECNYHFTILNGTIQSAATWMKNVETISPSSPKFDINSTLLNTRSSFYRSMYQSITTFTVIGKMLPNATMFRLTILDFFDKSLLNLKFNIKKKYISLTIPKKSRVTEYRRNLTINLENSIQIQFNSTILFINGVQLFNYTVSLCDAVTLYYGGKWEIITSYKYDNETGMNQTMIKLSPEKYVSPISKCSLPASLNPSMTPEKKIYHFSKPFVSGQSVYITTNNSNYGVINLRLQSTPCGDDNIPFYMTLSWANSYSSNSVDEQERTKISKISSNLTNNIIYNNPKLTIWSRSGNIWSDGKVFSSYSTSYAGPKTLQIDYRNNSLIIKDSLFNVVLQDSSLFETFSSKIQYLVVVDPFSVIKDVSVIVSNWR